MTQFVEKAPNHTYHIIERSKGDKEVRTYRSCTSIGSRLTASPCAGRAVPGRRTGTRRRTTAARLRADRARRDQGEAASVAGLLCGQAGENELTWILLLCLAFLQVFAFMQQQGFFCQLPFDPTHTEIGGSDFRLRCLRETDGPSSQSASESTRLYSGSRRAAPTGRIVTLSAISLHSSLRRCAAIRSSARRA